MTFTVVYDANVLYPAPLRDLLIRLAQTDIVRARWTDQILDETFQSVVRDRPDLTPERLKRTRELMCQAVRDCLVSGYEALVAGLALPDPDDRHVVAAAIRCGAQVIVTSNIGDFPAAALEPYSIEAQTPDEFVLSLIDLAPDAVVEVVTHQAAALKNPSRTMAELLDTLARNGLVRSVADVRARSAGPATPPEQDTSGLTA